MQALFSGEGERTSPKAHLNSDLNELNSTLKIETKDLIKSEQIGADNTK